MRIKTSSIIIVLFISLPGLATDQLKFDWGKSKAYVTETIEKKNASMTFRYLVELVKKDDGFVLQQNFVELTAIEGNPVENKVMARKVGGLARFPKFLIDTQGDIKDVLNEDEFINQYAEAVPDPQAKEMFKIPSFREVMVTQYAQKWCSWVCMWNDPMLPVVQDLTYVEEVDFMGSVLPIETTIKYHGALEEEPGLVKLTMLSTTDIDQPEELVENVVGELGQQIKPESSEIPPSELSKVTEVEAWLEPKTMKPHRVTVHVKVSMSSDSRSEQAEEKFTYLFDWQ